MIICVLLSALAVNFFPGIFDTVMDHFLRSWCSHSSTHKRRCRCFQLQHNYCKLNIFYISLMAFTYPATCIHIIPQVKTPYSAQNVKNGR